jgi:hypothetical protein
MIDNNFTKFLAEHNISRSAGKDPVNMLTPDSVAAEWN